jgi:hypothetical protein
MPFDGIKLSETTLVLIGARARLEKGWAQGGLVRENVSSPKYCMLGAINSSGMGNHCSPAQLQAWEVLRKVVGHHVPYWNDAIGRKHSEVLDAYDKAIAISMSDYA